MKELENVLNELKSGKACGPDSIPPEIFINGGKKFDNALLELVNEIKRTAEIPTQWNDVDITTIYKNKGKQKDLVNQRGIFLTPIAYKLFERLVINRTSDVTKNINLLQAGGRKGRSTSDQTFILRSLMNHSIYLNRTMYVTCYDYKQCFDKLWLQEAVLSLWRMGLPTEFVNIICKLNETSCISVKTPFGKTDSFIAKSITKQGTVMGPPLCSSSLGECLDEHDGGGATIGNVSIPALAFDDDMNSLETKIRRVHSSHETTIWFSEKKNQPLNEDKCCILCVNDKPGDVTPTLEVNGREMDRVDKITYIGDVFNRWGNNNDLIADRVAKGMRCMTSTIAECSDITLGQYSLQSLIMMYKSIFIPTILFNSGAWCNLNKQNHERLAALQMKFLKRILHTPQSTPNVAVQIELGIKPIENEIHIRQLRFLHHILVLPEDDPVRQVYNQQKRFEFERSWYKEIVSLLEKYQLEKDEEIIRTFNKERWKQMVNKQVCASVVEAFNKNCKEKKKTNSFPCQTKIQSQEYMQQLSPNDARMYFQIKSKVVDLKVIRKYMYDDLSCRLCQENDEDLNHVLNICKHIMRNDQVIRDEDIMCGNDDDLAREVVKRMNDFYTKVKECEQSNSSTLTE